MIRTARDIWLADVAPKVTGDWQGLAEIAAAVGGRAKTQFGLTYAMRHDLVNFKLVPGPREGLTQYRYKRKEAP